MNEEGLHAAKQKQTLQTIWFAMLSGVGMLCGVATAMSRMIRTGTAPPIVLNLLLVLAGLDLVLAWAWHRTTVARTEEQLRRAAIPPPDGLRLIQRLQTSAILNMALLESLAVYGLLVAVLNPPDVTLSYVLASGSLGGLALFRVRAFPTIFAQLDRIEQLLRQVR